MINITKVFKKGDDWAFVIQSETYSKGYKFSTRKGAKRGRAKMLRKIKDDGHKVVC